MKNKGNKAQSFIKCDGPFHIYKVVFSLIRYWKPFETAGTSHMLSDGKVMDDGIWREKRKGKQNVVLAMSAKFVKVEPSAKDPFS